MIPFVTPVGTDCQNPLAHPERLLIECCGWKVSDERIRRACQAEATPIAEFRADSPAVAEAFAEAAGDVEFQVDAAKVNTTGGWRDMKIGIFARREPNATLLISILLLGGT